MDHHRQHAGSGHTNRQPVEPTARPALSGRVRPLAARRPRPRVRQVHGRLLHHRQRQAEAPAHPQGDRGVHRAPRPSTEQKDADLPAEERHRLPRLSHLYHEHRQGGQKGAGKEHRQHEAQDPQIQAARRQRQDDTRERRPVVCELVRPYLARQHLPPAEEYGRLLLRLFPGAETTTERRRPSCLKN